MNISTNKYTKPIIALILIAAMLSSVYVGTSFAFISGVSTGGTDFVVFEGVAGNDYYDTRQYSYQVNQWANETITTTVGGANYSVTAWTPGNNWFTASKSLRVGMTGFGEFASNNGTFSAGLAYGQNSSEMVNTESWANSFINPQYYMQGWLFYMNYTRIGILRAVEGYAIYSDTATIEGGRKVYTWFSGNPENPTGASNTVAAALTAGRITGTGVQVLYDSARLAVGRTSTIIHDNYYNEDVAKVTITVVFNKDSKAAIVYKDVKILLDTKILDTIDTIAFQEKYEIDLARGINPSNQAFIHYYQNYNTTVYQHPLTGSNTYDVVQAFNPNRNYTFFAAYWPNTTEYAVYTPLVPNLPFGLTRVLPIGTAVADIPDSAGGEAGTPWVVAQWMYNNTVWPDMLHFLAKDPTREIRFVEVVGITDYNKALPASNAYNSASRPFRANDIDAGDSLNSVDVEVRYILNAIFNPADLQLFGNAAREENAYFMYAGLGQASIAADSAGATMLASISDTPPFGNVLGLFDKADTPLGTIPYALSNNGPNFNSTLYLETFNNVAKGTGNDATAYMRTGLNNFAFNKYDGVVTGTTPQPIAGGFSTGTNPFWYPSKNPLSERWTLTGTTWTQTPYSMTDATPNTNGIMTVGGPKANWISRYFNDMNYAITREGTSNMALFQLGVKTGTAPTSNPALPTLDFFPVSTWNTATSTGFGPMFNYTAGNAVISVARDINGTRGLSVYGWDARDTYWASAWAAKYLGVETTGSWLPRGTVAIILTITYSNVNSEPTTFTVARALGTITEMGINKFIAGYGGFDALGAPQWGSLVLGQFTNVLPPPLPATNHWWYAKVPTTSTALVDYDA